MTARKPQKAIAVVNLKLPAPTVIIVVANIVQRMTGNSHFPKPNPPLATVDAHVTALEKAQTVAITRVRTGAPARDAALAVLRDDVHYLKAYVQSVANADVDNASAIILSAGMDVKRPMARSKSLLTLKHGPLTGTVDVIALADASRRASYDWQYSTDARKTWVTLPATLQARTRVSNLEPGTVVFVRHRVVTKAGVGDWGDPVSIIVM